MVIGIDSHKETLAACAIDELGGKLAEAVFPNTAAGHRSLLSWARGFGSLRRIGIEGSGQYGRGVAKTFVAAGEDVVEVPPALSARERNRLRRPGKSDLGDALPIARVAAREARLPAAVPRGRNADLRLLLNYREQQVRERMRLANRLHSDLVSRYPGYQCKVKNLVDVGSQRAAEELLRSDPSVAGALAQRRLESLRRLSGEITQITKLIDEAVEQSGMGLKGIIGVGPVVAGWILAEVGDVRRFPSMSHFAAANGTAPIPAESGRVQRHRLNRGGNRRLNRALHTIALIQSRVDPRAKAYLERRRSEGKSRREAIRCLKRHLSNVIYRQMLADDDESHASTT